MKKKQVFGFLFIVLGVLLALTPTFLATVCPPKEDGHFMKCHWMGNAVIALGIAIVICAVIFLFVKDERISLGMIHSNIILGVLALLMPLKIIGCCQMPTMHCNTHTKPMVCLLSGIYILLNIIYLFKKDKANS
ncbi:DUF4418 family protein [Peptoniphilus mikwangii]|uniref:DUF4418 family protein n=1 Tax=Peptoniphilus mikwangii TaxID=1354300 RepID=UPI00055CEAA0|nr:DUF4418 family protein [Peptoniphilus mikwangii]